MRIKDKERFIEDLCKVWTNQGPQEDIPGLDLERDKENTLHEYCHMVTLGLKNISGVRRDNIHDVVGDTLFGMSNFLQLENEIITLAVEITVIQSFTALDIDEFLSFVEQEQAISGIQMGAELLLEKKEKCLQVLAKKVIRRIRNHAKLERIKGNQVSTCTRPASNLRSASLNKNERTKKNMTKNVIVDGVEINAARFLAALHNGTSAVGMGKLHDIKRDMTVAEAEEWLAEEEKRTLSDRFAVDYVCGRPVKVRADKDGVVDVERNRWLYDRDAGEGAFDRAVEIAKAL